MDFVKRIPKDVFEKWYAGQSRYRKRQHGTHVGAKKSLYISRNDAAELARADPSTISRWAAKGLFHASKAGKLLRIEKESFKNWLATRGG